MFWKVLYLGLAWYNSRILFSVQITFSDLKKNRCQRFFKSSPASANSQIQFVQINVKRKNKIVHWNTVIHKVWVITNLSCDGKKIVTLERSKKKNSKVQSSFQLWYVGRVSTLDKKKILTFYFQRIIIVFSAEYIFQVGKPSILEYQISKKHDTFDAAYDFLIKIGKLSQKWSFWTFSGNQEILSWVVNCK